MENRGPKALTHPKRVLKLLDNDLSPFPVTVHIGPMAGCNHDCGWCSELEYRKKYPGYLPYDRFAPVLEEMAAGGVESVVWVGSGEPTFHPQFRELVDKAQAVGLKQGLITNGSRIPVDKVDAFSWVRVSLDAGRAETHKLLHVVTDYDRIIENIRALVVARTHTLIGVSFLVCPENADDLPGLVKLLDEIGVDYIQVKKLDSTARYDAHPVDIETGFATTHLKVIDDKSETVGGNAGLPCVANGLATVMAPTGDMFLCCRLSNTGRDEEAHLGNIWTDGGFKGVWHGEKRASVVQRFRKPEGYSTCPTCWMTRFNVAIDDLSKDRVAKSSALFI